MDHPPQLAMVHASRGVVDEHWQMLMPLSRAKLVGGVCSDLNKQTVIRGAELMLPG
jgi:hypothetical protein